jgi:ribonuclease R
VSLNSLLEFDDFRLIEGDYSLAGMRSGRKFRMGDKIRIRIVAANLTKRQLDYEWIINTNVADDKPDEIVENKKEHKKKKSKKKD